MEKYLEYLEKDKIKTLILGLILSQIFDFLGIEFYIGLGIVFLILLVLIMNEKKIFVGFFKIKHKDICK
ncbi:MAG: hypothetical protein ACRC57_14135 [Sarcina sp.]